MWPKLAKRFGCHIPRDQFKVDVGKDADSVMILAEKPPIAEVAAQIGPEGNLRQNKVEQKIDLISGVSAKMCKRRGRDWQRDMNWRSMRF